MTLCVLPYTANVINFSERFKGSALLPRKNRVLPLQARRVHQIIILGIIWSTLGGYLLWLWMEVVCTEMLKNINFFIIKCLQLAPLPPPRSPIKEFILFDLFHCLPGKPAAPHFSRWSTSSVILQLINSFQTSFDETVKCPSRDTEGLPNMLWMASSPDISDFNYCCCRTESIKGSFTESWRS